METRIYFKVISFKRHDRRRKELTPAMLATWYCPRSQKGRFVRNTVNSGARINYAQRKGYSVISGGSNDSYVDVVR